MGGRCSRMCPHLPLPLPYRPVPVAVGAPPQEEVGKTLRSGLRPSGPRPEEGRGRRRGRGRGSQGGSRIRKGRGRSGRGLVEGGRVRAGRGPGDSRGGGDGWTREEGERKDQSAANYD